MDYTAFDNATPPQEMLRATFSTACRDVKNPAAVEVTVPFLHAREARQSTGDAQNKLLKRPSGAFLQALASPLAAVGSTVSTFMPPRRPSGARRQSDLQEKSAPATTADGSAPVGVKVLRDRKPEWVSDEPVLDFFGRAALASSKNMQLVLRDDVEELNFRFLMGKADAKRTNVDYCAPLSCAQAFAFALALFDNASPPLKDKSRDD
jgi:hypothetical protein